MHRLPYWRSAAEALASQYPEDISVLPPFVLDDVLCLVSN